MSKLEVGRDYMTVLYDLSPNYISKLERFVRDYCAYGIHSIANIPDEEKYLVCYFRLDEVADPRPLLHAIHKRICPIECDYLPSVCITKLRGLSDVWEYGNTPV